MNYSSFFKNLNDPLIKLVLGDNDKKSLKDLDLNNITISDATQEYLNEHFKTSTIKKNNQKIIKTLNHILGHIIGNKKSNGKYIYEFNDNFDELWFIHEKNSNTNKNYFIDDEECAPSEEGHIIKHRKLTVKKNVYEIDEEEYKFDKIHEKNSNTNENYFIDDEECA